MSSVRRVFFISVSAWNLVNFRRGLITRLLRDGVEVIAATSADDCVGELKNLGVRWLPLPLDGKSTNPVRDLRLLCKLYRYLRVHKPDRAMLFTVKPVIYGSMAARLAGVPSIATITGLGAAFINEGWVTRVIRSLYRIALRWPVRVYFQNADDRDYFVSSDMVSPARTALIAGSGVDLKRFSQCPLPDVENGRVFLLIGRMLWDKGIGEYVEAAGRLRAVIPDARFALLGQVGVSNPAAIDQQTIDRWVEEGLVEYWGATKDVRPFIEQAHCVVLPSYREGVPRSLLEASAIGRPLVATDVVGCREVVDHERNGFLCRARDAGDLAAAMQRIALLPRVQLSAMGHASRDKVVREFDEEQVIDTYSAALRETG